MMQSENSKLKVHTTIIPDEPSTDNAQPENRVIWKVLPHPKENRKPVHRLNRRRFRQKKESTGRKLTAGEKLLRNSAIACSLLLVVLALNNVDQPWTQQAADGVKRVVTMRVDLDETLGRLSFVRELVPEAALVFWNMGGESVAVEPVDGALIHEFDVQQPWLEYRCTGAQNVKAVKDGQVTAVGQGASDDWTVLIDHVGGEQTVYAYLDQALVKVGQQVIAGEVIGSTAPEEDSRLYFEYRVNGVAQNPTQEP